MIKSRVKYYFYAANLTDGEYVGKMYIGKFHAASSGLLRMTVKFNRQGTEQVETQPITYLIAHGYSGQEATPVTLQRLATDYLKELVSADSDMVVLTFEVL